MVKHVKWVCELPQDVQDELRQDAIDTISYWSDYSMDEVIKIVDEDVMNEKLVNIVGWEDGMLNPEKYNKYIFGREI